MKKEIQGLITTEERLDFERAVEKKELDNFLMVLRKDLNSMKKSLKQYSKKPEEIDNVQALTDDIENKISSFKERQMVNFDKLMEEETRLTKEIDTIVEKMDSFEKPSEIPQSKIAAIPTRSALKSLTTNHTNRNNQRVESLNSERERSQDEGQHVQARLEFQKKVNKLKDSIMDIDKEINQFGGKGNGWSDEDHQTFLRIKTQHHDNLGTEDFKGDCMKALPYLNELEIEEHIEKHKIFCELDEQKKKLIAKYKEFKAQHKIEEKRLQSIKAPDPQEDDDGEGEREGKLKRLKLPYRMQRTADERVRIREEVKDWKQQRAKSRVN